MSRRVRPSIVADTLRRLPLLAALACCAAALAAPSALAAPLAKKQNIYNEGLRQSGIEPHSAHPSGTKPYAVCPAPTKERFTCMSAVVPESLAAHRESSLAGPRLQGSGELDGYSPADLRSAYNLPSHGSEGLTVAITIAYDDPKAEVDLAVYRERYGLPECSTVNGCFRKVNQEGEAKNYPEARSKWAGETSLDLDMVSATCPECHILLVEANNETDENLPLAVNTAAQLGASVVSDSWGGEEASEESSLDPDFDHPGIPVLFASGDTGYGVSYPAASPDVIAVGGTSLRKDQSARGWRETAWSGAGSGCSEYEEKPVWQTDPGCARRAVADVSAVADPETPVSVYDTFGEYEGWLLFGGTSVSTPILAGVEALSSSAERSKGAQLFWEGGPEGGLFDISEGRNGSCFGEAEYLCVAKLGYDGPTGWGTPGGSRPGPPVVGTYDALGVNASEAMLNGAVNPNGEEATYRFEYGPTTSYGTNVPLPDASAGSGTGPVEVARRLTGLTQDATYHFRLVATNSSGITYGGDRTFAASPWSAQYMPRERSRAEEKMHGVSCASPSACMAVGEQGVYYAPPSPVYNDEPLVEHWDGSEWVRESVSLPHQPAEGYTSSLEDVSCSSPDACMAVGENYEIHVGYRPLVESWDGAQWSVTPMPMPSEASPNTLNGQREVRMHGISCVSATFCVAVGQFTKTWESGSPEEIDTLVEAWDGSSWKVQPSPNPPGPRRNLLWGVSCVSTESCVAVGESREGGAGRTLIESWDGAEWSIENAPSLSGGLQAVSCSSENACMAVGGTEAEGQFGGSGLAEVWNGSEWSSSVLEHPMRGVSCPSAGWCVAVGAETRRHEKERRSSHEAFAERWNGAEWSAESPVLPPDASDESMAMNDVSCVSSRCASVGWYWSWGYQPLAERFQLPPTVENKPVGTITQTTALLNGQVDNEGAEGGSACKFVVATEASPDTAVAEPACSPDPVTGSASTAVQASASSLRPNTHYVYRVIAENEGGAGEGTPDEAFSTLHDPPVGSFSVRTPSPIAGQPVAFDGSSSSDPEGTIANYFWDFGDGEHGIGATASHTYASSGSYTVTLKVSDDAGLSASTQRVLTVGRRVSNAFGIRAAEVHCNGRIVLSLHAPGPGAFTADATAGVILGRKPKVGHQSSHYPDNVCRTRRHSAAHRYGGAGIRHRSLWYGKGSTTAHGAGIVVLIVKPRGSALRVLGKHGRLRVRIAITYAPDGGAARRERLIVFGLPPVRATR